MPAPTEIRACSGCDRAFGAKRAANGRWPRTCSARCQVAALDRMIEALQERRAALAERVWGRV